ncbi:MAG: acyl carrier protein [Pseudomonadales bacterium]|nr:acyl carrier protein [Pseudomonadales bacterium]
MSVEQTLRDYILENYLFTDDQSELNSADSFMGKGILDSTGIMEIIFFIEEQFNIKVEDEEMVPENLDSVNNLVAFIAKKSG